jgi:hypothetical protein
MNRTKIKGAGGALYFWNMRDDQPFEARAALRLRLPFVSSVVLADAALEPPVVLPEVLLAPPLPPAPVLDVAPPAVPAREPVVPPAELAPPLVGSAAPISPAAVPGPARPALSVSAGDPCAAYAPATAPDMQSASRPNLSFLM